MKSELLKIMQYATRIDFNPSQSGNGISAIGISFANQDFPKKAASLFSEQCNGKKFNISFTKSAVCLEINITEQNTSNAFLMLSLNFDAGNYDDFMIRCVAGSAIYIVFGQSHNCDFYVIDTEQPNAGYQPMWIAGYY